VVKVGFCAGLVAEQADNGDDDIRQPRKRIGEGRKRTAREHIELVNGDRAAGARRKVVGFALKLGQRASRQPNRPIAFGEGKRGCSCDIRGASQNQNGFFDCGHRFLSDSKS
jgi:hypothetical protein